MQTPIFQRQTSFSFVTTPQALGEHTRPITNLYELLGVRHHKGIQELLRMSGVEDYFICGGASDFDKLSALVDVFPMWIGHPYAYALQSLVQMTYGQSFPTGTQALAELWKAVALDLSTRNLCLQDLYAAYGYKTYAHISPHPTASPLGGLDMTNWLFPQGDDFPHLAQRENLTPQNAMSQLEQSTVAYLNTQAFQEQGALMLDLHALPCFRRPHPYPAGQAYLNICQDKPIGTEEYAVFTCQMLRTLAIYAKEKSLSLWLCHVSPAVYKDLVAYLNSCDVNIPITCITSHHDAAISLAKLGGRIMLAPSLCATQGRIHTLLTEVASGMPLGRIVGWYLPVTTLLDLPLVRRIEDMIQDEISHL